MLLILKILAEIIHPFLGVDKLLIIETHFPNGSNTHALLSGLKKRNIDYVVKEFPEIIETSLLKKKIMLFVFHLQNSRYKTILNTNGYLKIRKKQIVIDYWHGIPLKSMLYMEERTTSFSPKKIKEVDYLITGSKIESTLLASCMFIPFSKHRILGSPRMEVLMQGKKSILDFVDKDCNINLQTKVGIFLPTFRINSSRALDGTIEDNIFNFKEFDKNAFEEFLIENNIVIVVKPHPLDERSFDSVRNVLTINAEKMKESNTDLYEILGSTDFLISDYSSIIYDYMNFNKSILIVAPDEKEYKNSRGFLIEPFNRLIRTQIITEEVNLKSIMKQELDCDFKKDYLNDRIHTVNTNIINSNLDWLESIILGGTQ